MQVAQAENWSWPTVHSLLPDAFKCIHMNSNESKWIQMNSNAFRWIQMYSNIFKCIQVWGYIKNKSKLLLFASWSWFSCISTSVASAHQHISTSAHQHISRISVSAESAHQQDVGFDLDWLWWWWEEGEISEIFRLIVVRRCYNCKENPLPFEAPTFILHLCYAALNSLSPSSSSSSLWLDQESTNSDQGSRFKHPWQMLPTVCNISILVQLLVGDFDHIKPILLSLFSVGSFWCYF